MGVAGFFLDLAVKDSGKPGRFLMGIECDGATYHSAKSTRDRDRLRQEILEDLGWNICRIWSVDWFKNPEACLFPILQKLESLKTTAPEPDITWPDMAPAEEDVASEDAEPVAELTKPQGDRSAYDQVDLDLRARLCVFQNEIIEKEFPDTDPEKRLLRPAMIETLIYHLPCSKGEFSETIPGYLRANIERDEAKFIEQVCELIADYG